MYSLRPVLFIISRMAKNCNVRWRKREKCVADYGAFRGKNYECTARVMSVFFACGARREKEERI